MRLSRAFAAALVAILCGPFLIEAQAPRQIIVVAKKFDFTPSKIELKVGEPVEITFQSEDTKHGFECKELKLEKVVFDKETPATVRFTPEKAGTFAFKCAKNCGLGHSGMKGEFVVSE